MIWRDRLPVVRGRLLFDEPLGPFTWFRVGGPADVLFLPQDEDDLADFLMALGPSVPVTVLGVGSNTLVRDGGVEGVVVRLGKAFATIEPCGEGRIFAGAAALDAVLAREAGKAGIAGLEFYRGVPGSVGGALMMNAGCYGAETKDVLVEAYALNRAGDRLTLSNADLAYRRRAVDLPGGSVPGTTRRSGRRRIPHGRDHRAPGADSAHPGKDRRVDLQEPAGPIVLETGR